MTRAIVGVSVALIALLPASGFGQTSTGSIGGVVRDVTGGVLPGVTVEAASPALIEKVRTVTSDDQGRYQIVDLRPGTYTVTFTLEGFAPVRREDLQLTAGFAATVNGELKPGALAETIVVSGSTPVVDVQKVLQQNLLTREELDEIPAMKTTQGFASLTLGASLPLAQQDVGGSRGESVVGTGIHGVNANDATTHVDGTKVQMMFSSGSGQLRWYKVNQVMAQEVTLQTAGISAEGENGGFVTNVVPREGGNRFSLYSSGNVSGAALQSENLTDELRSRGVLTQPRVEDIYDLGVGVGGPIVKDRVWFYTGHRRWATNERQASSYYNRLQGTLFYEADLSRPTISENWAQDHSVRINWQVSHRNKITFSESYQNSCTCPFSISAGQLRAPEAAPELRYRDFNLAQASWTFTATNRLLVDAGFGYLGIKSQVEPIPETSPDDYSVTDIGLGNQIYGAQATTALASVSNYSTTPNHSPSFTTRYSMSYVTGSHAFKVGAATLTGRQEATARVNHDLSYVFNNRRPVQLVQYATPHFSESRVRTIGAYAQDQWAMARVTLNLGLRFDYLYGYNPAQVRPAGAFTPEFRIAEQKNVPNWKDLSPRIGGSFDVFGNAKTAVKGSLGRYVTPQATGVAQANNPANAIVTSTSRIWTDDGNYTPNCDLLNAEANGECGAISDRGFGTVRIANRYSPDVLDGFGVRPYTWQVNASVQHELRENLAVNAGYYRTWYGNFTVTHNQAVTAADFSPYCVTTPSNPGLPGGGGYQVCGFNDITPQAFGAIDNLIRPSEDFGGQSQVYDGFEFQLNARFRQGVLLSGGVSTGKSVVDACDIALAHPEVTTSMTLPNAAVPAGPTQSTAFCRSELGFGGQTQVKLFGTYPLPWGFQAAATFQSLPGLSQQATWNVSNALIAPSLGRDLGQCRGVVPCTGFVNVQDLFERNTQFEGRLNQLDLRLTKRFRAGPATIRGMIDLYNVFNAATIANASFAFGTTWLTPTQILPGRLLKFGFQLDL